MSDPVPDTSKREALRGAEGLLFDLIFEVFTSGQWAELLKAPLERAAAKGSRDLAQRLVRAGAQTGVALHEAIHGGHEEIVGDLVDSEASLAVKDADGYTPLHVAARRGKAEMVQLFLLKGADKDAFDNHKCTPLFQAARHGNSAAVLALLTAGAEVNLRCGPLESPVILMAAQQEGRVDILRAVIDHGADLDGVNTHQFTALHCAAEENNADVIDVLVEAGANIEARDGHGCTPLHFAGVALRRQVLLCLLKHGANVNAQDDDLETPLMYAAGKAGTQGTAEAVDSLLRAGADETVVDVDGNKSADCIGEDVDEEDRLAEDFERVRELLANAPADRAWRRRGYLALCRAHLDRVQQIQVMSGTHHTDTARKTRSRNQLARAEGVTGDSTVEESAGSDWAVVMSKVLWLQEEGIFRTIVEYL